MKKIIINSSPTSLFTMYTVIDDVPMDLLTGVTIENLQKFLYATFDNDCEVYLQGNREYNKKIKEELQQYIVTKNSNFANINIVLL